MCAALTKAGVTLSGAVEYTASPTCATPALCSVLAALISPKMSVTRLIDSTTAVIVAPD